MSNIKPDPEPFGPFTLEEVRESFREFDLDDNDFVGSGEIRRIFEHLDIDATDEEIDEMIKMMDASGDGQIDLDEWEKMIFKHSGPPIGAKKKKPLPKKKLNVHERAVRMTTLNSMLNDLNFTEKDLSKIQKQFKEQEKDGECNVDYENFKACIFEEEGPLVSNLFKLLDAELKGKIDGREFLISVVNLIATAVDQKIRFAFNIFDADSSGSIDKDELGQILKATHLASSVDEIKKQRDAIMRQGDTSGDGELDFEEFDLIAKKFPNLIFPSFIK